MTPDNNIYTLLITFIAFSSFISSKFHFPYKLFISHTNLHYAWAACVLTSILKRHVYTKKRVITAVFYFD